MKPGARLWLRACVLLSAFTACDEQRDLVALARPGAVRDATACEASNPECLDAGARDPEDACAADGCKETDACADARACEPADACADNGSCAGAVSCDARVCGVVQNHKAFCAADAIAIAVGDGCDAQLGNPLFRFALCSRQGLNTVAPVQIEGDVSVDDNEVSFGADAQIAGSVRYGGGKAPVVADGVQLHADAVEKSAPNCGAQIAMQLDVVSTVQAFSDNDDNDDAAVSSELAALGHFTADRTLTLPCGRYYVGSIDGNAKLTIHAEGTVALFVDGNVHLQNGLVIDAANDARITLVVSGAMNVNGGFTLGNMDANQHLLVIGNGSQLHLTGGSSVIGGTLYAPDVELVSAAPLQVNGALYVRRAQIDGTLVVYNASAATRAAVSCDAP